jgi:pimeloyl-ACP methyl ester carboxylesterase
LDFCSKGKREEGGIIVGKTDFATTDDGKRIHVFFQKSQNPIGNVILCHGITVDLHEGGFFDTFAHHFLDNGIAVVRFDYRGHGRSDGTSLDVTLHGETTDVEAVFRLLQSVSSHPEQYALVAASFSCASAIRHSLKNPPVGLVLLNPILSYRRTFIEAEGPWGKEINETLDSPSLPARARARIPGTDFFLSDELWKEMEKDDTATLAAKLNCPILAFHGDRDTKVPLEPILEFARANPNRIELQVLKGQGHGFKGARSHVMSTTVEWIKEKICGK